MAHSAVAAGVAEHSDFRSDPWRRLDATLRSYLRIVYGSTNVSRGEIRRLNVMHLGIRGDGYAARDPALALWVHATLIDSTIVANDAWLGPLTRDRVARFYEETRPIGLAFGVPESMMLRDLDGFQAYVEEMLAPAGPVRVGPTARDLANVILHPSLPGRAGPGPDPDRDLRLDDVAVAQPPAAPGQGRVRLQAGSTRAGGHALARGRLASLEPAGPGRDPPDAAGSRRGPQDRRAPFIVRSKLTQPAIWTTSP